MGAPLLCELCLTVGSILSLAFLSTADSDSGQWGRYVAAATNNFKRTTEVVWRKRDSMATLSVREGPNPCLDRLLLLFCVHYIILLIYYAQVCFR